MPATTRITRNVLAERVLRILEKEGQSSDSTYDIREVRREIDNQANKILKSEWFFNRNDGNKDMQSHFMAEFENVSISTDGAGNNYCDIPVPYLSLPQGMGVFRVAPEQGDQSGVAMIPLNPYDMDLLRNLPASTFEKQWSYELRRNTLHFNKKYDDTEARLITLSEASVTSVRLTVAIIDPSDIGDNDEYPLMPEQVSTLLENTINFFNPSAKMYMEEPVTTDKL